MQQRNPRQVYFLTKSVLKRRSSLSMDVHSVPEFVQTQSTLLIALLVSTVVPAFFKSNKIERVLTLVPKIAG